MQAGEVAGAVGGGEGARGVGAGGALLVLDVAAVVLLLLLGAGSWTVYQSVPCSVEKV
jgi:hypothetical protein